MRCSVYFDDADTTLVRDQQVDLERVPWDLEAHARRHSDGVEPVEALLHAPQSLDHINRGRVTEPQPITSDRDRLLDDGRVGLPRRAVRLNLSSHRRTTAV